MTRKVKCPPFRVIRTVPGVLRHCGGISAIAKMFGITETTPCNWKVRGIPPEYYVPIQQRLAQCDPPYTALPSLFQMRQAAAE
jgi:hypothetical protein